MNWLFQLSQIFAEVGDKGTLIAYERRVLSTLNLMYDFAPSGPCSTRYFLNTAQVFSTRYQQCYADISDQTPIICEHRLPIAVMFLMHTAEQSTRQPHRPYLLVLV